MKKLVSHIPLPYQIFLSVFIISILSIIQLAIIDKACLALNVTCTVKIRNTDSPIPQAVVKLKTVPNGETTNVGTTDNNGMVVIPDVDAGTYDIIADAQCFKSRKFPGFVIGPGDEEVLFTGNKGLTSVGETKKGSLSGLVKDGITKGPINNADVKIKPYGPTEQTDVDGFYAFDCIEANTVEKPYKVSANADGYAGKTEPDVVVDAGISTTLDFELFPPNIKGKVTNFVTGKPILDVLVEALSDSTVADSTETIKGGKYFIVLDPGTYIIRGSKFGYSPEESPPVDLGLETERVNLQLTGCEATLEGRVWEKGTDPKVFIKGVTVRITDPAVENPETKTDVNGKYKFDKQCLEAGETYTVEAEKCGYETKPGTIDQAVAGENKLNFKLLTGGECTTTTTTTTTTTSSTTSTTTTTTTSSTTSTTLTPGSTTTTRTTTTTSTTTTTLCKRCAGVLATITFSKECNSFTFAIGGESGPRTENLDYKRDGKSRIITVCGTVTYANSGNTYCVEINVTWGFFCISNVQGFANRIAD